MQTEVLDEFLFADDMANGAPTEEKMQKGVDQISDTCGSYHYENTPIQIYRKFLLQKFKIFRYKNCVIFHISARNIDCGYSLEPPRRGGSNEYPQSMF